MISNTDSYTTHDSLDAALIKIEDFDKEVDIEYSSSRIDLFIISKNRNIIMNNEIIDPYMNYNEFFLYKIISNSNSLDRDSINVDYNINKINLVKGDRLFMWTDGLYEQIGVNDCNKLKKYSKKKFIEFLLKKQKFNLDTLTQAVSDEFNNWRLSIEQFDDITFIGLVL